MKRLIIIIYLQINISYGQENKYLDSLSLIRSDITTKINLLNDNLKKIDRAITDYQTKQILKNILDSSLVTTSVANAKLKSNPTVVANIIATLKEGTKLTILDYVDNFFGVCTDSICGYMHEMWVNKNAIIDNFIKLKEKEKLDRKRMIEESKALEDKLERREQEQKYIKKYGLALYNRLKEGKYWIGMTFEMAAISLGSPNDINRTVGAWGVHEQWVYSNKGIYLYFENGKLKSYED